MEDLQYVHATISDLPQIIAIYNATIPGRMVTADTDPVTVESKIPWFHEHTSDKRPLWLIKKQDLTIGWISLQSFYGRPAYDGTAEISIYLHRDYQGKGFGRQALRHSIEKCAALAIKTLLGFIFLHNEKSLNLFYSSGFQKWGTLPNVALLDGIERSLVIVGKRIS
jgi:phosphinothricin acetyltransferase